MSQDSLNGAPAGTQSSGARKPWATPQLTVYGKIVSLTGQYQSDRSAKAGFSPVDSTEILSRLASLPIETWHYKVEDPSVRHLGPMAQDFHAAFGLGDDNTHIHSVDAFGVAFAAIQALHDLLLDQSAQIADLNRQLAEARSELQSLRHSTLQREMAPLLPGR
jgi:hypothetical protein